MLVFKIIKIRLLQIYRELKHVEIHRAIILVLALGFVFIFLFKKLDSDYNSYIISGISALAILLIHKRRKDYYFLLKLSNSPYFIFFSEYLFFSSPLIVLLFLKFQLIAAFLYLLLLILISFLVPKSTLQKNYLFIVNLIPGNLFEWKSGFRKNLLPIFLFYSLGLFGFVSIWFSVISVFVLSLIILTFYSESEPRKILEAEEIPTKTFINKKLLSHGKYFGLFIFPIFLISLTQYEFWIYILISFIAILNLQITAILLKYSYYYPNNISGAHQFFSSFLMILTIILPSIILIIILNLVLYFKASNNLNTYLNAYN